MSIYPIQIIQCQCGAKLSIFDFEDMEQSAFIEHAKVQGWGIPETEPDDDCLLMGICPACGGRDDIFTA